MIDYVSLHNHTSFSIMSSLVSPMDLFKRCKELGQTAVAVTDSGTMAGMWDCLKASKKVGIKFIAGCEFYFVDDVSSDAQQLRHIVLLAKNAEGYKNLLQLNRKGYDNFIIAFRRAIPRIDWKLLKEHSAGLICTTACGNGILSQLLMKKDFETARTQALRLKEIFGDNLALELQPHTLSRRASHYSGEIDQRFINLQLSKLSTELGIRPIVATDSHYLERDHHRAHDVQLAIGSGQPIYSGARLAYNVPEFHVKSAIEVAQHFVRLANVPDSAWSPEFIKSLFDNTIYFADQCEQADWIDPKYSNPSGKELPTFPVHHQPDYQQFLTWRQQPEQAVQQDLAEDAAYLRYCCETNFSKMVPVGKEHEYRERLKEEIEVIEYHGFSSYMLIVADYIDYAKKKGVRVGPGRGCLTGETSVLTSGGFKLLSQLDLDDKVYTHTGELNDVLNKFEYDIDENGIEIVSDYAFNPIQLTSDHKVLANIRHETEEYKRRTLSRGSVKRWDDNEDVDWVPASALRPGDRVFMPFPQRRIEDWPTIDIGAFAGDNDEVNDNTIVCTIPQSNELSLRCIARKTGLSRGAVQNAKYNPEACHKSTLDVLDSYLVSIGYNLKQWQRTSNSYQKVMKRFIVPDNEFFYFVGRWVGDGWITCGKAGGYRFGLAFHAKDTHGMARIEAYMRELGLDTYRNVSKTKQLVQITAYSKIIFNLFQSLFPDYKQTSCSKHLPVGFRSLDDVKLRSLLDGCCDSDGHKEISKNCNRNNYDTTSHRLAMEFKEALLYLGIPSSINTRSQFTFGGYQCKSSYKVRWGNKNYDCGYLCPIREINNVHLKKVYDITTSNHSYVTSNFSVHNSVGGSLIAYLLNIHVADPIKYKLIFARFHNKEKTSFPDIDTDFASAGRQVVQDYIRKKYGENYVAHVSNVNTITPKVYARDIARTFEFGNAGRSEAAKIGNSIADSIPSDLKSLKSAFDEDKAPLLLAWAEQHPELKEFAATIGGKARAWSTHAGGLIIGNRPLADIVPVRRDKDGSITLEYDKDRAEENGLVKMDTLGLETLDIIDKTYEIIKSLGKEPPPDPPALHEYDQKTYELIGRGDTFCVFQLASIATPLCRAIKPKNIEEISHITALVRPSAKSIVSDFIETRDGKRPVQLMHPLLQRAFGDTYGFGLYEECLMYLAQDVAGWDLHSADRLRKMTKDKGKNPEKIKKLRTEFIEDAVNKAKLDREMATRIWDEVVAGFGGYGFNMPHATLYSLISFFTAFLKAHFPLEFLVANLMSEVNSNAKASKENIIRIKTEIRALGVRIVAPDINTSSYSYKIVDEKTLMTGLDALKYMGKDAIPEITSKRPFKSFEDFLSKIDGKKVRAPTVQAMAASGCLDSFGLSRKLMFLHASDYKKKLQVYLKKPEEKRGGPFQYPWPEDKSEWSSREKFALEEYYMGEGVSGTVQERFQGFFDGPCMDFSKLSTFFQYKNLKPEKALRTDAQKEEFAKKKRYANSHNIAETDLPPMRGIITHMFSFKVKKEDSKYLGQEMARLSVQDQWGNELSIVAFPNEWQHIQDRVSRELAKKKGAKLEPGIAIDFGGSFQYENEHTYSFIITEIYSYQDAPSLPEDLKSRKVKMPRVKKAKKNLKDLDKETLAEELEDEMIEDGLDPIDDEDVEENMQEDPFS